MLGVDQVAVEKEPPHSRQSGEAADVSCFSAQGVSSSFDRFLMISSFLARRRSSLRLRASFVFERRASAWSLNGDEEDDAGFSCAASTSAFLAYGHWLYPFSYLGGRKKVRKTLEAKRFWSLSMLDRQRKSYQLVVCDLEGE
ncbi:hypothetical protein INR49_005575 [Caranx melampygus]|nr:hypothetical protein INR49_005575 [Caranx melampygus]